MTEEMGTLSHCTVEDLYLNTSPQTSETGGRLGLVPPSHYHCAITAVWNVLVRVWCHVSKLIIQYKYEGTNQQAVMQGSTDMSEAQMENSAA